MFTCYDRAVKLGYIRNLMKFVGIDSPLFAILLLRMEDMEDPCFSDLPDSPKGIKKLSRPERKALKQRIIQNIEQELQKLTRTKKSQISYSVGLIADYFKLSVLERSIFDLILRVSIDEHLEEIFDDFQKKGGAKRAELYAVALDVSETNIKAALSSTSKLIKYVLVMSEFNHYLGQTFCIPEPLVRAIDMDPKNITDIKNNLTGKCVTANLKWDDFQHINHEKEIAVDLIRNSIKRGERGINILLYGPPGTGKTEFCKTLAAQVNADLYAVSDLNEDSAVASGIDRLKDFILKQQWIPQKEKALILFDEMEDVGLGKMQFRNFSTKSSVGSKAFFNRMLEENPVPVLWTCNDTWWFDEAFLRRMSLAIELKQPTRKHMRDLLANTAEAQDYEVSSKLLEEVSSYDSLSPGVFSNSVRVAKIAEGNDEVLKCAVKSVMRAMNGTAVKPSSGVSTYKFNPSISNADIDLCDLRGSLSRCRRKAFSLCLYGPPGTGKSAFARDIADEMGMDVVFKRASDLLSMWVGGTEQNIAAAFEEALNCDGFLIIDEADSFLRERSGAQRSWEVTQVNEVLTWLESHPLPVAFTTNHFEGLDSASLRRFTFKVKFNYMNHTQANEAFELFFDLPAPPNLQYLDLLTPGDFASVKKRASIMGCDDDPDILCKLLTEECEVKPAYNNPIGFRA